jgi:hypothetical protein
MGGLAKIHVSSDEEVGEGCARGVRRGLSAPHAAVPLSRGSGVLGAGGVDGRRLAEILALPDGNPARLGLFGDRHPDREDPVVQVRFEVLEVEAVAELNLAAERTAVALAEVGLVAVLALPVPFGSNREHVAFHGDVECLCLTPGRSMWTQTSLPRRKASIGMTPEVFGWRLLSRLNRVSRSRNGSICISIPTSLSEGIGWSELAVAR